MEPIEFLDILIELYGDDKPAFYNALATMSRAQKVDAIIYYGVTCAYDINSDDEQKEFDEFINLFKNTDRNLWVIIDLQTAEFFCSPIAVQAPFFTKDEYLAQTRERQDLAELVIDELNNTLEFGNRIPYALPLYFLDYTISGYTDGDQNSPWTSTLYEFIKANGESIEADLPYLFLLKAGEEYNIAVHCGYNTITRVN